MNKTKIKLQQATGNVYLETVSDFKGYYKDKEIESNCIAISFKNKGTNTATVNNLPLATGQSLDISQPTGFIDSSRYNVAFTGAGTNDLTVIRILPKNQS